MAQRELQHLVQQEIPTRWTAFPGTIQSDPARLVQPSVDQLESDWKSELKATLLLGSNESVE